MGYHRAGFEVVGVDIVPQPRYPFEFHQADAMTFPLCGFDVIHASPPCQAYTQSTLAWRNKGKEYADLLPATRERLQASGIPWVIENVPRAPMRPDLILCGSQFQDLNVIRHRWFEFWESLDWPLMAPCQHRPDNITVTGRGTPSYVRNSREKRGIAKNYGPKECGEAMGIDWMTRAELSQAIPPAYTTYIGQQLMQGFACVSR
jgi:DNA (cytosine-5)-methyltransferase 1